MICLTANTSNSAYQWVAVIAIISVCLLAFVIFECIRLNISYTLKEKETEEKLDNANRVRDNAILEAKASEENVKSISREILSPLNAIRAVVSLISKESISDEAREYCDILRLSANRLAHVAEDILGIESIPDIEPSKKDEESDAEKETKFYIPSARILVVDDNRVNLKVACALLNTFKCEVVAVDNAYEAIDRVRSGEVFDLIFMDHLMPGMDGIEATKHIHALQSDTTRVPIIAITANTGSDLELSFFKAGMCDFLPKPILLNHLTSLLKKWIPLEKQVTSDKELSLSDLDSLYDPGELLKDFWDDTEIFNQLLNQFLEEGDALIPLLDTSDDRTELAERLKSFARYSHSVGADSLVTHLDDIAESLDAPDKDFYTSLIRPLKDEYSRVSESIRRYLNS